MITCIFASIQQEGDRDAAGIVETLPRVLPVPGGDKKWYLYAARAGLSIGVASHRRGFSLNTIARGEPRTNRPAPPPFSLIMARQRRWLAVSKEQSRAAFEAEDASSRSPDALRMAFNRS